MLNAQELSAAETVLKRNISGQYTLRQMYGDDWSGISSPTSFGKRFYQSVLAGQLMRVLPERKKSDNAWLYTLK